MSMQMFKRGQIGSGITLFWTTVIILIIILVFSLMAMVVRPLTSRTYDSVIEKKLFLDDYMAEYRSTLDGLVISEDSHDSSKNNYNDPLFDPQVSLRYFPTRGLRDSEGIIKEGDRFSEEEIFRLCSNYKNSQVVFVTGVFEDSASDFEIEISDAEILSSAALACKLHWEFARDRDEGLYGVYDFSYSRIEGTKGDVCCYGK